MDKPAGISSFSALGTLKKNLGTRKVGHAGTLDPFATGLLLALSGKLTRSVSLLSDMDKEYEAVFRFGEETDTLDTEGEVIAEAPVPEYSVIQKSSILFSGTITQIPPAFSAIKINGKRAYSSARKGLEVEMPERQVQIMSFELLNWNPPDLSVRINCSKGTYIRSIARDLGLESGSRAFCSSLRRTAIGPFSVDSAVPPDSIMPKDGLLPVDFFQSIGVSIKVLPSDIADRLRQGFPVSRLSCPLSSKDRLTLFTDDNGIPAALMELKKETLHYSIVFDSVS